MKKVLIIVSGVLVLIALAVSVWFIGYYSRKSNDNLPNLDSIAEMEEEAANKLVTGYLKTQLRYIWDEPDESSSNMDMWVINENVSVIVGYNNDKAVVCGLLTKDRSI